ncbi:hypothetical protein [Alkalihalobacterium elongatum]|uniref:hypothetical protein n=1 Tax=Alkalihalobacterium elongatum TaxID=2675466 RepID=UPI001C1FCEBC|nr:hypothetical protein [Alkalihalobacterium elongatum]
MLKIYLIWLKKKTDENDVKVIINEQFNERKITTEEQVALTVDKILTEKEYMTETEVKNNTKEIHLKIVKWTIGTGLSVAAIILALLRVILL